MHPLKLTGHSGIRSSVTRLNFTVNSFYRYLVSQDSTVPVKSLTDTLSKRFPQYKFAQGQSSDIKKVIDNSKVGHVDTF